MTYAWLYTNTLQYLFTFQKKQNIKFEYINNILNILS